MARQAISLKTKQQLWGQAAGRCEICNKLVFTDSMYGDQENLGQLAHICAVETDGPRHDGSMTADQINSIDNLMLLCTEHHKLIDSKPDEYPKERLCEIKKSHEERIRIQTEILEGSLCQIVTYFMDTDEVDVFNKEELFKRAAINAKLYPGTHPIIALHDRITTMYTPTALSFQEKAETLSTQVQHWYNLIVKQNESVALFALAPQPLLFKLGSLLPDQLNIRVFQCHREGEKWAWADDNSIVQFQVHRTLDKSDENIALVIDLSAAIVDSRITDVLGNECSIYHLTIDQPNRSFVKNAFIQNEFINQYRCILEKIRTNHPTAKTIHVFPAMPNSLAIRAGMDTMSKVDLPLLIYDQLKQGERFEPTITIGG